MTKKKNNPQSQLDTQLIPLNRLKKSPRNARTVPHTKEEIEALAASIAAHGLLQNPVVEPELDRGGKPTGNFLVTAGEGRRQALLLRAKRGEIPKTHPVRCTVDAEHDPHEISLAENTVRTAMHPADQFEAFHDLHTRKGLPAEDIAARFGVTPAVVRQRLKLACVSPKLMAAYRAGTMTLDQLTAFTVTDDMSLQERVWDEAGPRACRQDIVATLTDTQVPASDPRAVFVGAQAYQAAGGAIVQDLFEDGGGYFADAALLFRLAGEKLEGLAQSLKAEGWKWVEIMPRFDHAALADCRRIHPARKALSEEEAERLEALEAEYEALEFDGSDDSAAVIERIETAIAALEGEASFDPGDIARAGVAVTIGHDGTPRIERGFVRPEDEPETANPTRKKAAGPAALSERLVTELTAFKTMALREALGEAPDAALTAATHALALATCFHFAGEHSCLQLGIRAPHLAASLSDIEETAPARRVAARHETVVNALPEDPADLWDHLAAQTAERRLALFAHCIAYAVDAVHRPGQREDDAGRADALARAVSLDMAATWRPTAKNYLGRVSKDRILEAVREAVSPDRAKELANLPKAAMAEAAEKLLAETTWLPERLRIPPAPRESPDTKARRPKRPRSAKHRPQITR